MRKFKNIPEFDRPREKMEQKGAMALSNLELLAVLLGSGIKGKKDGYYSFQSEEMLKRSAKGSLE